MLTLEQTWFKPFLTLLFVFLVLERWSWDPTHALNLFQRMSDTWTTRLSVKADLNCAACSFNTVYLFVCVWTPADDKWMERAGGALDGEPAVWSQVQNWYLRTDDALWEPGLLSVIGSVSPRCYTDSVSITASSGEVSLPSANRVRKMWRRKGSHSRREDVHRTAETLLKLRSYRWWRKYRCYRSYSLFPTQKIKTVKVRK